MRFQMIGTSLNSTSIKLGPGAAFDSFSAARKASGVSARAYVMPKLRPIISISGLCRSTLIYRAQ